MVLVRACEVALLSPRLIQRCDTTLRHSHSASMCHDRKWLELCPESEDAVSAVETLKELLQQVQEAKYSDNSAA